jgi:hypothetical protein
MAVLTGGLLLALAVVLAIAARQLAEMPWPWLRYTVSFSSCVPLFWAIYRMQAAFGGFDPKQAGLMAIPCLLLPGWLWLSEPPLDPQIELRTRRLPGFRIDVPGWRTEMEASDYFIGALTLRRGSTKQTVSLNWHLASEGDPLREELEHVRGVVGDGLLEHWLAGSAVTTRYYQEKHFRMARTAFSCDEHRTISVLTTAKADLESVRALHARILDSVECVPTPPPVPVTASIDLPPGFSEVERGAVNVTFESNDELLQVAGPVPSEAQNGAISGWGAARFVETLAGRIALKLDGSIEELRASGPEGRRRAWRVAIDEDGEKGWLVIAVFSCGSRAFTVIHVDGKQQSSDRAIDRIQRVSCPR